MTRTVAVKMPHPGLLPTVTLQPHQSDAVSHVLDKGSLILHHGTGTGKTFTLIAAAEALKHKKGATGNVLVVVPAALKSNFIDRGLKQILPEAAQSRYHVHSYEYFRRHHKRLVEELKPDILLADEIHRARDPQGRTYAALQAASSKVKHRILATASLISNHPSDVVPLVHIAAGRPVFGSVEDFNKTYIHAKKVRPGIIGRLMGVKPGHVEKLKHTGHLTGVLAQFVHRFDGSPESRTHFPTLHERDIEVPMSGPQKKVYDYAMDRLGPVSRWMVEHNLPPGKGQAASFLGKLQHARQIANSSHVMDTRIPAHEAVEWSPKLRYAVEEALHHLNKDPQHRVMLYTNMVRTGTDPIVAALRRRGVHAGVFAGNVDREDRNKAVSDYNKGKVRALVVSPAGAEGLDLKGTTKVLMVDPHWNPEKIRQAIGRGARYKSHEHLPANMRHVEVEHLHSIAPWSIWHPFSRPTLIDRYVSSRAREKADLNKHFTNLIKHAGLWKIAAFDPRGVMPTGTGFSATPAVPVAPGRMVAPGEGPVMRNVTVRPGARESFNPAGSPAGLVTNAFMGGMDPGLARQQLMRAGATPTTPSSRQGQTQFRFNQTPAYVGVTEAIRQMASMPLPDMIAQNGSAMPNARWVHAYTSAAGAPLTLDILHNPHKAPEAVRPLLMRHRPAITREIASIVSGMAMQPMQPAKAPRSTAAKTAMAVLNDGAKKLVIGLDFDNTYTADPKLWERFIDVAKKRGHKVTIVTARTPDEHVRKTVKADVPIVFTSLKAKRPAADAAGHKIDVWIDDRPQGVDNDHPDSRIGNGDTVNDPEWRRQFNAVGRGNWEMVQQYMAARRQQKTASADQTPEQNLANMQARLSRRGFLRGAIGFGAATAATVPSTLRYLFNTHFENKAIDQNRQDDEFARQMRARAKAQEIPTPKVGALLYRAFEKDAGPLRWLLRKVAPAAASLAMSFAPVPAHAGAAQDLAEHHTFQEAVRRQQNEERAKAELGVTGAAGSGGTPGPSSTPVPGSAPAPTHISTPALPPVLDVPPKPSPVIPAKQRTPVAGPPMHMWLQPKLQPTPVKLGGFMDALRRLGSPLGTGGKPDPWARPAESPGFLARLVPGIGPHLARTTLAAMLAIGGARGLAVNMQQQANTASEQMAFQESAEPQWHHADAHHAFQQMFGDTTSYTVPSEVHGMQGVGPIKVTPSRVHDALSGGFITPSSDTAKTVHDALAHAAWWQHKGIRGGVAPTSADPVRRAAGQYSPQVPGHAAAPLLWEHVSGDINPVKQTVSTIPRTYPGTAPVSTPPPSPVQVPKVGAHVDRIPGGLADKRKPSDFPSAALLAGIKVELEHTNRKEVAREIAMDHLTEDKQYYEKLRKIEKHAAPRWVQELAAHVGAGKAITPEWERALAAMPKERQVMPLGEGMEGIADLMAGQGGLSVRKLFYNAPWKELLSDKQRLLPGARATGLVPPGMGDITASPSGQEPMQRMPYLPEKAHPGDVEMLNDLADRTGLPAADIRSRNVRRDVGGTPYVFDPLVTREGGSPEAEEQMRRAAEEAEQHAKTDPAGYAARFAPDAVRRRAHVADPSREAYVPPSSSPAFTHVPVERKPVVPTPPARASASAVPPKPLHEIAADMWRAKTASHQGIEKAWLAGNVKKLRAIAERIKQKKGPIKFVAFAGRGSEGIADIVTHPHHGLAVRKIYDPESVQRDAVHAWNKTLPDAIRKGIVHPDTEQARPAGHGHVMVSYAPLLDTAMSASHPMGDDRVLGRAAKVVAQHARASGMALRDIHAGNVGRDLRTGKPYAFDFLPKGFHPPKPDYHNPRHRLSAHLRFTERGQQMLRDLAEGRHVDRSRVHEIEEDAKRPVRDLHGLKDWERNDLLKEMRKAAANIEKLYPPKRILGLTFRPDVRRVFHGPGFGQIQCGHIPGTSNPADGGAVDVFSFTIGRKGKITKVLALSRKNTGNDKYLVEIDNIPAPKDWEKRWKANAAYAVLLDAGKVKGREEMYHKDNYATGETWRVVGTEITEKTQEAKRAGLATTAAVKELASLFGHHLTGEMRKKKEVEREKLDMYEHERKWQLSDTPYGKVSLGGIAEAMNVIDRVLPIALLGVGAAETARGVFGNVVAVRGLRKSVEGAERVDARKAFNEWKKGAGKSIGIDVSLATTMDEVQQYVDRVDLEPKLKKAVLAMAKSATDNPLASFMAPITTKDDKKIALVVTPPKTTSMILAHELGHVVDFANGMDVRRPSFMANLLWPSYEAAVFGPEQRAWDIARVPSADPTRQRALDTYKSVFHANRGSKLMMGGSLYAAGRALARATTAPAEEKSASVFRSQVPKTVKTRMRKAAARGVMLGEIAARVSVIDAGFLKVCEETTGKLALVDMTDDELTLVVQKVRHGIRG